MDRPLQRPEDLRAVRDLAGARPELVDGGADGRLEALVGRDRPPVGDHFEVPVQPDEARRGNESGVGLQHVGEAETAGVRAGQGEEVALPEQAAGLFLGVPLATAPPKNQPRSKRRLTIHRAGIPGANAPAELAARTGSLMTTTPSTIALQQARALLDRNHRTAQDCLGPAQDRSSRLSPKRSDSDRRRGVKRIDLAIGIGGAAGQGIAPPGDILARIFVLPRLNRNADNAYQAILLCGQIFFIIPSTEQPVLTFDGNPNLR